ncbi:hypothetical protein BT96DRAFT_1016174 [Gymnopus androsaceus JB14]|uniref:Uncharacterized protein n=1 Tax=Gymnopus androsaceus JB14 TaxID=1447944 RepID=A0A6A4I6Y8_9AGAR|nr:hypothetical protein BT96DRAFT_1016174 [Gymnopus androsaceus JB14]
MLVLSLLTTLLYLYIFLSFSVLARHNRKSLSRQHSQQNVHFKEALASRDISLRNISFPELILTRRDGTKYVFMHHVRGLRNLRSLKHLTDLLHFIASDRVLDNYNDFVGAETATITVAATSTVTSTSTTSITASAATTTTTSAASSASGQCIAEDRGDLRVRVTTMMR